MVDVLAKVSDLAASVSQEEDILFNTRVAGLPVTSLSTILTSTVILPMGAAEVSTEAVQVLSPLQTENPETSPEISMRIPIVPHSPEIIFWYPVGEPSAAGLVTVMSKLFSGGTSTSSISVSGVFSGDVVTSD